MKLPVGKQAKRRSKESTEQEHRVVLASHKRRRPNDERGYSEENDGKSCHESEWSAEEHRAFACAIYKIGLKHSSPSILLENMSPTIPEAVTSERVKSHLQKYRAKGRESENEFLSSYDAWISNAMRFAQSSDEGEQVSALKHVVLPAEMTSVDKLSSDAMEAHLGFSIMMDAETQAGPANAGSTPLESFHSMEALPFQSHLDDNKKEIQFPRLSDDEKQSPLGVSMSLVMGLFISLRDQIAEARTRSIDMKDTQCRGKGVHESRVFSNEPWKEPHEVMAQSDRAAIIKDSQLRAPFGFASSSVPWDHPPTHLHTNTSLADGAATEETSMQPLPLNLTASVQMPDLHSPVDMDHIYQAFQVPSALASTSSIGNRTTDKDDMGSRQPCPPGVEYSPFSAAYSGNRTKLRDEEANLGD